jgi:hypothetical protein
MHVLRLSFSRKDWRPRCWYRLYASSFVLMLLVGYLYTLAGFENVYFNASFKALQPIVPAMVCMYCASQTLFGLKLVKDSTCHS